MNSDTRWIDALSERCKQRDDRLGDARQLYRQAESYRPIVFDELIKDMRFAVQYFRARCDEGRHILEVANRPHEYLITAEPPYSVTVELISASAHIEYEKKTRQNPRADIEYQRGRMLIKTDFHQSYWLEHKGKRLSTHEAAQFLLSEMFELLVCE